MDTNQLKTNIQDDLDRLYQLNKDMLEVQSGILRFGESPNTVFISERLENQKIFFNSLAE